MTEVKIRIPFWIWLKYYTVSALYWFFIVVAYPLMWLGGIFENLREDMRFPMKLVKDVNHKIKEQTNERK